MINHPPVPADLVAALTAEADDIANPQELLDRARAGAPPRRSAGRRRRQWQAPVAVMASILIIVAAALTVWASDRHHSRPATGTPAPLPTTKAVTFSGVRLTLPATWPVIDGAHTAYTCSSTFVGQSDRAFLGVSYRGVPSCAMSNAEPPPADGVWMQPGGSTPPPEASAATLPSGQEVYLSAERASAVTVWYHGVSVQIGIGPDPAVELTILNSIAYSPASVDSAVLGQCPTPGADPPSLPTPTRTTAPLIVDDNNARLDPEPSDIEPKVTAATVWSNFLPASGRTFSGAIQWSITFGSYSAQTPARINPNGSATPDFRNVPTWLIQGKGIQTDYGPCGVTVIAPYSADTGRSMGVTIIG